MLKEAPAISATGEIVLNDAIAHRRRCGPFLRWHLRGKYRVMEGLFDKYLAPGCKFIDMACGTGDALLLASLSQPQAEIWGLDIYTPDLEIAKQRVPSARVVEDDMHQPEALPKEHFDIVHEFGAASLAQDWAVLARVYFSLLCDGGILLWELPQRWSTGHVAYLFSVAPKITAADTRLKRVLRSFSPKKYHYESDDAVKRALESTGCDYEILEKVPIWHFYCRGVVSRALDFLSRFAGDRVFDWCDDITARIWPRFAGYYLVVRKVSAERDFREALSSGEIGLLRR